MSNLETAPAETPCGVDIASGPVAHVLPGRDVPLGRYATVRRMLPDKARFTVGAWCFLDHFGPDDLSSGRGMLVPPHPHIGLQTVSWLLDGEIEHRDSLGCQQVVRPGGVNVMTAGRGIAHAETSPTDPPHGAALHGLQLWIALPHAAMDTAPDFVHVPTLPYVSTNTMLATVVIGDFAGMRSPAPTFTPIVGVDLALTGAATMPLQTDFEYAVISTTGSASVAGTDLAPGSLLYLGAGRDRLVLHADQARLFLLGGEPFADSLVMWWNFVARDHDEIVAARAQWEAARDGASGTRFAMVPGSPHEPLPAPPMPMTRLKPRSDRSRS